MFHHTVMSLKFSDRQIWANIVNPNQTAPGQGLWCLSFSVHLSSALVFSQTKLFNIQDNFINVFVCQFVFCSTMVGRICDRTLLRKSEES